MRSAPLTALLSRFMLLAVATIALPSFPALATEMAMSPHEPDYQCDPPVTQLDMNFCARDRWQAEDDRLDALYERLEPTLSDLAATALAEAQLAWAEYRDAECEFATSAYMGGSIAPLIYHDCRQALTAARADELAAYIDDRRPDAERSDFEELEGEQRAALYTLYFHMASNVPRSEDLSAADTAWTNYRYTVCELESILGQTSGRQNCRLRVTEQRLARLQNYLEQRR
ncbi:MAG: lysozyme inhibitor LprI family protein [Geitlerinemataceae cyanobacterium]